MTLARGPLPALAGALASAALLGVAARLESPWHVVSFIALAPWLAGLERAGSLRVALGAAAALAAGMAATVFWWFPAAIASYAHTSPAVAWPVMLVLAPLVIEPQLLCHAAARHLGARWRGRVTPAVATAAALIYLGADWALPRLFGDTLGTALYPAEGLRQAAELVGARGLGLLLLLSSEALVALALRRQLLLAAAAVALVAAASLHGSLRLTDVRRQIAAAPALTAGVVQANITAYDKLAAERGAYDTVAAILDAHFELSGRLLSEGPLDLLVWPETVYPTTFGAPKTEAAAGFDRAIAALATRNRVPLVFGAFEDDAAGEYNSAFFLSPAGTGVEYDSYRKSLLFPVTERLPAWLDFGPVRRLLPWAGRWRPGPGPRVIEIAAGGRDVTLGPLICYEVLDVGHVAAEARAGAQALVALSNDAWFNQPGARLHLVSAAFRSIETRRPMLRATNSGISALVLPDGELAAATGFGEAATLRARVPLLAPAWTPVVAWGDWSGPGGLGLGLAMLGALGLASRLRR